MSSKADHEYGWERIARYSTASQAQLRPSVVRECAVLPRGIPNSGDVFGTASRTVRAGKNNVTIYWYSVIATAITPCTVDNKWVDDMSTFLGRRLLYMYTVGTFSLANSRPASSGENYGERQVRNFGLGLRRTCFWNSLPPSSGSGFWSCMWHHLIRNIINLR